jgi:hypothetical protein
MDTKREKEAYQPRLRLLTLEQAALELAMSKRSLQRHLKEGSIKLRAVRLGGGRPKYRLADLIALVDSAVKSPGPDGNESAAPNGPDATPTRQLNIPWQIE